MASMIARTVSRPSMMCVPSAKLTVPGADLRNCRQAGYFVSATAAVFASSVLAMGHKGTGRGRGEVTTEGSTVLCEAVVDARQPSPNWLEIANTLSCGTRVAAFMSAVTKRGSATELMSCACGKAALELLQFGDFISTARVAQPGEGACEQVDQLGEMAILLHTRFVEEAAAMGGVPDLWASAFRNALADTFAFPLLSAPDVADISAELRQRGVSKVVDPLAGTGLHARLFRNVGLTVVASDACPAASKPDGLGWFKVDVCRVDDFDWAQHTGTDVALLLSWPPRWSSAGDEALANFRGQLVVFVGDRGQWTGSATFHQSLEGEWVEVWRKEIFRWPRMEDDVRIYARRKSSASQAKRRLRLSEEVPRYSAI